MTKKKTAQPHAIQSTSLVENISIPKGVEQVDLNLNFSSENRVRINLSASQKPGKKISRQALQFNPRTSRLKRTLDWKKAVISIWAAIISRIRQKNAPQKKSNVQESERKPRKVENWLFVTAVAVYLLTRLISLPNFPIYFFTDEAVQTVLAGDFVRDGLKNYDKEFLPTYFVNGSQYNLGTSVYLQIIPLLLLGKSIWVTRGTAVLASLMAAIAVGLILKNIFKSRYYWAATLLLSITPAWFLHSRTAFETALAVSFFAVFLYFYLMYRFSNPKYIYAAVIAGALCFYSYSPAQMVMAVLFIALWFSDLRYHWKNKKHVLIGLGVLLVTMIPYIRFLIVHGRANYEHLVILRSYWVSDFTLGQKLLRFASQYLQGLNPAYWFFPNNLDFSRHLMKGYGHILPYTLPFFAIGLVRLLVRIRESSSRVILFVLLAAPAGAALVEMGITRALFMVIPVALITAIGLEVVLAWLGRFRIPKLALAIPVFTILVSVNGTMLYDSLKNGPTWYQDYTLGGMQYGASQLFGEIKAYLQEEPSAQLVISPSWANGTDILARFFFKDPLPFQMAGIESYLDRQETTKTGTVFILPPEEYQRVLESGKFTDISILKTLPYPNGKPGFYFITMRYVDNAAEIFAAEAALRRVNQTEAVTMKNGETISVSHSPFDMGTISDLFDGNKETVTRTREANPMHLEISFSQEHDVQGITVRVGGVESKVTVTVYPSDSPSPQVFSAEKEQTPDPREVTLDFSSTIHTMRIDIDILSVNDSEPAHVHAWEVIFK